MDGQTVITIIINVKHTHGHAWSANGPKCVFILTIQPPVCAHTRCIIYIYVNAPERYINHYRSYIRLIIIIAGL